jgi:lysophospholipase L1-like esterase
MTWRRFVAIGDSTAEGLDDPDGEGGYRGWADRLAHILDDAYGDVLYANLAIRGRRTHEVLDLQLPAALELEPDLVAVAVGVNDILRPGFHLARILRDIERIHRSVRRIGADVVTFTQPDPGPVMPLARPLRPRVHAFNDGLRRTALRTGAVLVDLGAHPMASDPRLWSDDRLHANSLGHERIAAAMADALAVPGSDATWADPLPDARTKARWSAIGDQVTWMRTYLVPWLGRRLSGASSGDGSRAKRPELRPVE